MVKWLLFLLLIQDIPGLGPETSYPDISLTSALVGKSLETGHNCSHVLSSSIH
jgi:hypothetical protein